MIAALGRWPSQNAGKAIEARSDLRLRGGRLMIRRLTPPSRQSCKMKRSSVPGGLAFICIDWRHISELLSAARSKDSEVLNLCVWTKTNAGMGSLYRSQHELVFVFKLGAGRHRNNVQLGQHARNRTNVWNYATGPGFGRAGEEGHLAALHPTVKPTAMIADAILDVTRRGDCPRPLPGQRGDPHGLRANRPPLGSPARTARDGDVRRSPDISGVCRERNGVMRGATDDQKGLPNRRPTARKPTLANARNCGSATAVRRSRRDFAKVPSSRRPSASGFRSRRMDAASGSPSPARSLRLLFDPPPTGTWLYSHEIFAALERVGGSRGRWSWPSTKGMATGGGGRSPCKPVSAPKFLVTGENTGLFALSATPNLRRMRARPWFPKDTPPYGTRLSFSEQGRIRLGTGAKCRIHR